MLKDRKNLLKIVSAIAFAGLLLFTPCISDACSLDAQMLGDSEAKEIFSAADKNNDKLLTKDELKKYIISQIKEKVGDSIPKKELEKLIAQVPAKVDGYFDSADKNGDDKLDFTEFKNVAGKIT